MISQKWLQIAIVTVMMICFASLEMVFGDFSQVIGVPGTYRDLNFGYSASMKSNFATRRTPQLFSANQIARIFVLRGLGAPGRYFEVGTKI